MKDQVIVFPLHLSFAICDMPNEKLLLLSIYYIQLSYLFFTSRKLAKSGDNVSLKESDRVQTKEMFTNPESIF